MVASDQYTTMTVNLRFSKLRSRKRLDNRNQPSRNWSLHGATPAAAGDALMGWSANVVHALTIGIRVEFHSISTHRSVPISLIPRQSLKLRE